MQSFQFNLFADYFQFYIQDEAVKGDLSDGWDTEATARMMAVAPGTIGIGTVRNMNVPVTVEIHEREPKFDFDEWDHVVECDLNVSSGRIVIAGCTDYFPDAARIDLPNGDYAARASFGALDKLSEDGLEGEDRYRIQLWRGSFVGGAKILKARANIQR